MFIYFSILLTWSILAVTARRSFELCASTDVECIRRTAQSAVPYFVNAIPELGIDGIDPFKLERISLNTAGLNLLLTDVSVKGFNKLIINDVKFDIRRQLILMDITSDFKLKGNYVASGRVAVLPVNGKGKTILTLRRTHIKTTLSLKVVERGGKKFIQIGESRYTFQVDERAQFQFENLFDGNKLLSETLHQFINTNWKLMIEQFGDDIFRPIYNGAIIHLRNIFDRIPIEDLITDSYNY